MSVRCVKWCNGSKVDLSLLLFAQSRKNNAIHIPYKCELLYSNVLFDKISGTERIATTGYCAKPDGKSRDYSTGDCFS